MAREFIAQFKSLGADTLSSDFKKIGTSTASMDKGLSKVSDTSTRTSRRMSELSTTLGDLGRAVAGLAIGKWLGDAALGAAQFDNSMKGIAHVVGDVVASDLSQWIEDNGDRLNISKEAAAQAGKSLSIYAKQLQDAGGDASKFTTDLIGVAGELAAFSGAAPTDVLDAIQGALRGEFDPLERFGITLKATSIQAEAVKEGLIGVGETMSNSDRIQATYALLMEDSAFAMGTAEANSGSLTGVMADLHEKMDNLQLTIGQALLPSLTQLAGLAATLFEAFNKLPKPVQTLVLALGTVVALKKTLGPVLSGFTTSLTNFKAGIAGATGFAGKFKAGIGGIASAFNPWTLAITGGITLLTMWTAKNQAAKQAVDEMAAGIDGATGKLNEQGKALIADQLKDFSDQALQTGISFEQMALAATGSSDDYDHLLDQLIAIRDANASYRSGGAHSAAVVYNDTGNAAIDLISKLTSLHSTYLSGIEQAKAAAKATAAVDAASSETDGIDKARESLKATSDVITKLNENMSTLLDNYSTLRGDALSVEQATVDMASSFGDLRDAVKENGDTLAENTAKGAANRLAIGDFIEKQDALWASTLRETGSRRKANQVVAQSTANMRAFLTQQGFGKTAVDDFIASIKKTPKQRQTQLDVIVKDQSLINLNERIKRLKSQKAEFIADFHLPKGSQFAQMMATKSFQAGVANFNTKITGLEENKKHLDDAAKPGGKDRNADIDVKPKGLEEADADIDRVADQQRNAYIDVYTRHHEIFDSSTGGGGGPGTPTPTTTNPTTRLQSPTADLTSGPFPGTPTPTATDTPFGVQQPAVGGGTVTMLQPRSQNQVKVFLDGEEIATKLAFRVARNLPQSSLRRRA